MANATAADATTAGSRAGTLCAVLEGRLACDTFEGFPYPRMWTKEHAMAIRIMHTADNHVGLTFQRFKGDPEVRSRLIAERVAALGRIVHEANRRNAHFLVVAGDLFDRPTVPQRDIETVVESLGVFAGEAVLVLPGNHDFCDGPTSRLWEAFRKAAGTKDIHVLAEPRVESFDVEGHSVRFYPCPCPSKLGEESLIGWVAAVPKDSRAIHLGVAHGNVEGFGNDSEGRYFNMRPEALRAAGVTTWLLGHIHVPHPTSGSGGRPAFFMPGIHTPDSVKCGHPGHAWYVEVTADGVESFEQITSGAIRFARLPATLQSAADIATLRETCSRLTAADTVLDLQLDGRLKVEDRRTLDAVVKDLRRSFLSVTCDQTLAHEITREELAQEYPSGSVASRILERLFDDADHPDAVWLAHELFQRLRH